MEIQKERIELRKNIIKINQNQNQKLLLYLHQIKNEIHDEKNNYEFYTSLFHKKNIFYEKIIFIKKSIYINVI